MGKEPVKKQSEDPHKSSTMKLLIKHKEQKEYRSLQTSIKKKAKLRGYRVKFKKLARSNREFVDALLETGNRKIAMKIFVTGEENLGDIEKYINAGYETVVACAKDLKVLEKIRVRVRTQLSYEVQNKVLAFEPDGFFLHLDQQLANELSTETIIKGYRVKVTYVAVSESEAKANQDNILKVVMDAIKKKGGE